MEDKVKERVKYFTEWIKALLLITVAIATGVITLFKKAEHSPVEYFLLVFGFFITFVLLIAVTMLAWFIYREFKNN